MTQSPEYLGRLSSPEFDFGARHARNRPIAQREKSPVRESQVREPRSVAARGESARRRSPSDSLGPTPPLRFNRRERYTRSNMAFDTSPPAQEYKPPNNDTIIHLLSSSPPAPQILQESSSDDAPIISSRRPIKRDNTSPPPRDRERRTTTHQPNYREPAIPSSNKKTPKPTLTKNGKPHKKPGPQPWAAKPISKNDMVAKKGVIREIESYWGKSFIRSYIPKVHRPLVKRGTKRPNHRAHETDPKNWLPSVLKAILMIAKLTNNKTWLKAAMDEVVRYRIKNTGNRKPQLVTTDFDVIEDILVKGWEVGYAFEIRYKHLLVNRKEGAETDEDIEHILQVADGESESGEEDEGMEMDGRDGGVEVEDDEEEFEHGGGGISESYQQSSGYTRGGRHTPTHTPMPRQQTKQHKTEKPTRIKSESISPPPKDRSRREQTSFAHGLPMPSYAGPWGAPMPPPYGYHGYPGFPGFPGFPGYAAPPQFPGKNSRQSSQHPHPYGMYPPPHHMSPMPGHLYQQSHCSGGPEGYQMGGPVAHPGSRLGSVRPKIKREEPGYDEPMMSDGEFDSAQQGGGDDEDEDIDDELEAAELELKLAKLRAKKAAQRKGR